MSATCFRQVVMVVMVVMVVSGLVMLWQQREAIGALLGL
jgi:uncharacterized iron-regulated membrane protein